jgi:hypothetical protein
MQIQNGAIVNEYGFTVLAKVNDTLVSSLTFKSKR